MIDFAYNLAAFLDITPGTIYEKGIVISIVYLPIIIPTVVSVSMNLNTTHSFDDKVFYILVSVFLSAVAAFTWPIAIFIGIVYTLSTVLTFAIKSFK